MRPDRRLRSNLHELASVRAGEVRYGNDLPFTPQDLVGEPRYVAHVDPRADHPASLADLPQRPWHKRAGGCEDDRGIEFFERRFAGSARPDTSKVTGELLAGRVAVAGESEHPAALRGRNLYEDVSRCTKAVEPEPFSVAGAFQRAVADETGTEQRRGLDVAILLGNCNAETGIGEDMRCIAAVPR